MIGGKGDDHGHHHVKTKNVDSLTYVTDESDVWRGHVAIKHMTYRGRFWNEGKYDTLKEYFLIAMVGVVQASIAYFANISSSYFIKVSKYAIRRTYCTAPTKVTIPCMYLTLFFFFHRASTVMSTIYCKMDIHF
jgi:hypothetical protein